MASYRIQIRGTSMGVAVYNTISFATVAVTNASVEEAVAIATKVRDAWQAQLLPILSNTYAFTGVDAQAVGNPEFGAFVSAAGTGALTGEALPSFVTAKVTLTTGLRGRAYRGRTGISGLREGDSAGQSLTTGFRETLEGRISAFVGLMGAGTTASYPIIVSTVVDGAPRPVPITTPVQGFSVSPIMGSQVGRKLEG